MIPVTCGQCEKGHDYAAWLAGMRVQCKGCKAWLDVPRPEGSPPSKPAPVAAVPTVPPPQPLSAAPPTPTPAAATSNTGQSWVARRGPTGSASQERPPGISDAVLTGRLDEVKQLGATSGDMVAELVELGCTPTFAAQFVAKYLAGTASGNMSMHVVANSLSITGLEGMTEGELREDLKRGGRFVIYHYCVSAVVVTFKKANGIQYVRSSQSRFAAGAGCTLTSLALGWWGIPWGVIYTISCVVGNSTGGTDVTDKVLQALGWRVLPGGR